MKTGEPVPAATVTGLPAWAPRASGNLPSIGGFEDLSGIENKIPPPSIPALNAVSAVPAGAVDESQLPDPSALDVPPLELAPPSSLNRYSQMLRTPAESARMPEPVKVAKTQSVEVNPGEKTDAGLTRSKVDPNHSIEFRKRQLQIERNNQYQQDNESLIQRLIFGRTKPLEPINGSKTAAPRASVDQTSSDETQPDVSMASMGLASIGPTITVSKPAAKIPEHLVAFVKQQEGFRPKAYGDFKQTSIGYGTKATSPNEVIDVPTADARLRGELVQRYKRVQQAANQKGINLSQNQIAALASFDYNTGSGASVIQKATNANDIKNAMLKYVHAGGKVNPGLVKRRQKEVQLFSQTAK